VARSGSKIDSCRIMFPRFSPFHPIRATCACSALRVPFSLSSCDACTHDRWRDFPSIDEINGNSHDSHLPRGETMIRELLPHRLAYLSYPRSKILRKYRHFTPSFPRSRVIVPFRDAPFAICRALVRVPSHFSPFLLVPFFFFSFFSLYIRVLRGMRGKRKEFNLIFPFSRSSKSRVFCRRLSTAPADSHLRAIPRAPRHRRDKGGNGGGGVVRVSRKDRRFRAIFTKKPA